MSIKEAAAKVTSKVTGKLTEAQWQTRVDGSQAKLDKLKAEIVKELTREGIVSFHSVEQVLNALGLEVPAADQRFEFTVPVTLDRTYAVLAPSKAAAVRQLLSTIGENGDNEARRFTVESRASKIADNNVKRDVTSLKAILDEDEVAKTSATDTPATSDVPLVERYAALEAEYEALVAEAAVQAQWLVKGGGVCESGVNNALRELGLDLLPSKKYFTVEVPVAGVVQHHVAAYSEDEAATEAATYMDRNRRNGRLDYGSFAKPSVTGDSVVTVVERY